MSFDISEMSSFNQDEEICDTDALQLNSDEDLENQDNEENIILSLLNTPPLSQGECSKAGALSSNSPQKRLTPVLMYLEKKSEAPSSFPADILNSRKDTQKASPVKTDTVDPEETDSDDDVIFVERNEEIIELSDDEAKECAELIDTLKLPQHIIRALTNASNDISLKIGDNMKSKNKLDTVFVEIPSYTWSLPWKAVSGLFKYQDLRTKRVSKRKSPNDSVVKKKVSKGKKEASVNGNVIDSINIKREKMSEQAATVIRFSEDKPPEFCEVSRSGRVIKKPTRLHDDLNFFRKSRIMRKKDIARSSLEKSDDLHPSPPSDPQVIPISSQPLNDNVSVLSESSAENSIDSESCDKWILGLDSESEEEIIIDVDTESNDVSNPYDELVKTARQHQLEEKESLKRLRRIKKNCPIGSEMHNHRERERRNQLRVLFCNLIREVLPVIGKSLRTSVPKVTILNETITAVGILEQKLISQQAVLSEFAHTNQLLSKKLSKLRKSL